MTEQRIREIVREELRGKPQLETPWPPDGMAIQVYESATKMWAPVISAGNGLFQSLFDGSNHSLSTYKWRYWPAPKVWPEEVEVKMWLALGSCEYIFEYDSEWNVGDSYCGYATVLHVERRPEGV